MGDGVMSIMANKIPEGGGLTAPVSFDTGLANKAMDKLKAQLSHIEVSSFDGKDKIVNVRDEAFKQFGTCGKQVDITIS